ncbi:AraC family transcriptional regulator [Bacillus sp. FJAT-27264]|uniref:AraC family transcriptional regulator n=1 Tax=Paenibacillus sp. (strain DSM 101736 / FJAT-27264) TaxID=1850362 RepID=UPI0015865F4A|nr:AraC family transcriptional regulator [Bacillus sp. FJAT-27264]
MELTDWKSALPPVFNRLCEEIQVMDVIIEWVDIIFEQIGTASKCPPHAHTWFEFNYVLTGRLDTHFGGNSICVQANEFFLIPPGMVHSHTYTKGNPHEGLCFRWRIRRAEGAEENVPGGSLYARLLRLQKWKPGSYRDEAGFGAMLIHFLREAELQRSELGLQLLLVGLLEQLCTLQQSMEGQSGLTRTYQDPLVRKVEIYLEDYQGGRLSVAELAASLHMSYGHLSRQYKKLTGHTIVERMNQIRLEKAAELLRLPDTLVSESAEQAGFADLSYFSRAFKKRYGQSPLSYRKEQIRLSKEPGE